jgi:hypothetical protein
MHATDTYIHNITPVSHWGRQRSPPSTNYTFRFYFHQIPHTRSPVSVTLDLAFLLNLPNLFKRRSPRSSLCYVGGLSSLPDHLVSDLIPQRNPEHRSFHSSLSNLELVDQPCRERVRDNMIVLTKIYITLGKLFRIDSWYGNYHLLLHESSLESFVETRKILVVSFQNNFQWMFNKF